MTVSDRRQFVLGVSALLGAAVLAAAAPGRADGGRRDGDHDEAREEHDSGRTLPLEDVLEQVRPQIDGEIIEIEFESEHGRPVYEFKYVDRSGRVRELLVDARDGTVLQDRAD